jgi:hypothetical protein
MSRVAVALRSFAAAAIELADAWDGQETSPGQHGVKPERAAKRPRVEAPKLDTAAAKALAEVPERDGLTKTETKILTALAQAGHPLSAVQIGTRCGLSSKGGAFAKSLTDLRSSEFIEGGAARIAITDEGLEALGPYARLPDGPALFDYWCAKVGSTGAKVLVALRHRHRERLGSGSAAELGAATGLSHKGGAFAATLTKLRKLELIQGGGAGMELSPELQRAGEITIGVHDRQSGKTVHVDRVGKVVR